MNHFAVCCRSGVSEKVSEAEGKRDKQVQVLESFNIDAVSNTNDDCWVQNVKINDIIIPFKIDTGADISVIPLYIAERLNATVKEPGCTAVTYTGQKIPLVGSTVLDCEIGEKRHSIEFVVVEVHKTPLLGLKDSIRFGVIQRIYKIGSKLEVIEQHKDIFEGLGKFPILHKIHLSPEFKPFIENVRRVPYAVHDRLRKKLEEMVGQGIIKKVDYPTQVVNPVVIVEKKNGDLRVCLDLRRLNEFVTREPYIIPTIEDITQTLEGKTVFSVLDLKDGYYHVELDEISSDLCTFGTIFGRYKFMRLPFGIKSAPEVFQSQVSRLFGDIPGVCIYFDDLLIAGATEQEHDQILMEVFNRARKFNVRFNKTKIQFKQDSVKYMGQRFTKEGIAVDEQYIAAILHLTEPTCKEDVLRVLGIVKYVSKFMPHLSEVSTPLRELTRKDQVWKWTEVEKQCFEQLKKLIVNPPILAFFDKTKETEVHVDASNNGLGACLIQENRPVAFASRTLTSTEQKYAIIEKEMLAIYFGVQKFHQFVYGKKFVIKTDHKPLINICIKQLSKLSPRLQRIRTKLLDYEFDVLYKPGREMLIPDALSRAQLKIVEPSCNIEYVVHGFMKSLPISSNQRDRFLKAMAEDQEMQMLHRFAENGWPKKTPKLVAAYPQDITTCEGLFIWENRVVVPKDLRQEMLRILHTSHVGIEKTKERAKQTIVWPGINSQIEEYIRNCQECQKFARKNIKEPLLSHPLPERPWERVFVDILTYKNLDHVILVDSYSNWIEVASIRNKSTTEIILKLKAMFSKFGIPEQIICDNVPFASDEFKNFAKEYCFDVLTRSPNYPQSNAFAERGVGIVKSMLKKVDEGRGDIFLSLLEYRNTPLKHLKLSPSQLLMNRTCRTRLPSTAETLMPKINEDIPMKLKHKQLITKKYYDRGAQKLSELLPGEAVWIEYPDKEKWQAGTIIRKHDFAPRSYILKDLETGRTIRRNRRQIRKRRGDSQAESSESTQLESVRGERRRRRPLRFEDYV